MIIIRSGETQRRLAMLLMVWAIVTIPTTGGVPWATGIKVLYTYESDVRNEEARGSKNELTSVVLIIRHSRHNKHESAKRQKSEPWTN